MNECGKIGRECVYVAFCPNAETNEGETKDGKTKDKCPFKKDYDFRGLGKEYLSEKIGVRE